MKPVRTAHSNMVYTGPPGVGDLGNIELDIFSEPIPPVSLNCSDEDGIGEDAPEIAARLAELKVAAQ